MFRYHSYYCWTIGITAVVLVGMLPGGLAHAASEALSIDFDVFPTLPAGPSTFAAAGATQTITIPGKVSISGGVVLGYPTNIPAINFATTPNLYGTASPSGVPAVQGDPSLSPNIVIQFDPLYEVTSVEGLLFNGNTEVTDYTVRAFSGTDEVDSQVFSNLASNLNEGNTTFSLVSASSLITSVVFEPESNTVWDYFIDTLAFNTSIENAADRNIPSGENPDTPVIPTPTAVGAGLVMLGSMLVRRRRVS